MRNSIQDNTHTRPGACFSNKPPTAYKVSMLIRMLFGFTHFWSMVFCRKAGSSASDEAIYKIFVISPLLNRRLYVFGIVRHDLGMNDTPVGAGVVENGV